MRNIRRRKKLRAVALQRNLELRKIALKNVAFPTMLALLAPGLEILGAEGLNDLVADLNGGWPDMPSIFDGSGPIDGIQNHLSGALSGNSLNLASLVCLCS